MANTWVGRLRKGKTSVMGWAGLILVIAALAITSCGPGTSVPQTPSAEERGPFSARRESGDGAIVAWSGYTQGYQPGADAEFDITITNETGQTWDGRYCLQLLDRQMPQVVASLEQRAFTLEPGVGFSDVASVQFPNGLDAGAYGLSLAVRRSGGPMVDVVPIEIGQTDEVRRATTQRDMDASLDACPPVAEAGEGPESLMDLAKADLGEQLGIDPNEIEVRLVQEVEFPDTSLGVPEPGKAYAEVLTRGYIIELAAQGKVYVYHGSEERLVAVSGQEGQPPSGRISIEGVEVTGEQVVVHGASTLPDGTCLGTELWADGAPQAWWPADTCVPVQEGTWQVAVPLGAGEAPAALDPSVQYVVRAWLPGGPDIVSVFAFDLTGPPQPAPADAEPLIGLSKADLTERLGISPGEVTVQSVERTEFPDASLGVPEPGTSYAQVVTPGYVISLTAQGDTYTYHGADGRVVLVPASPTPRAEEQGEVEIPEAGARVTLPLHFLARVAQPMEPVTATLRWQDGTELSQSFTALRGDGARGLLIGSLDWRTEGTPPQPETQRATLTVRSESEAVLATQTVTVLSADDPGTERIDLYWLLGESLETEQRRIVRTAAIEAAALEELLWGPPPQNLAGFHTAIPTPEEVLAYPGRGPDWGSRVRLQGLTIENGVARADFSEEMQAYGGGSARVLAIREQITRTLKQFPTVQEVIIAVAGETEGVLQP